LSSVSVEIARRFLLGRQGLWPGRRWEGRRGVDSALRYIGSVQYDPLDVVGRSHDLALWGRIVGYRTEDLEHALYTKRTLFESGGNVQIRPIEELPYLRIVMLRRAAEPRWRRFARGKAGLLERVTRELENRGPLGPGDLEVTGEKRVRHYRAGKESGLALYYLWLRGDTMIAYRRRAEKIFDLTDRLFPRRAPEVPVPEAEEHILLQTLRSLGLAKSSEWFRHGWPRIGRYALRDEWPDRVRRWKEQGVVQEIDVDGWKGPQCVLADAVPDLERTRTGDVPSRWRPRSTTTEEEVVFLAPLEGVIAGGRASQRFGLEYTWEVYKPKSKRRWGYYTLPILWGDRLCARIEMRVDRATSSLRIVGFWPEEPKIRQDPKFATALARALVRLADLNDVGDVDPSGLHTPTMQRRVAAAIQQASRHAAPGRSS
jgi:uncharacterized protein YcaQ